MRSFWIGKIGASAMAAVMVIGLQISGTADNVDGIKWVPARSDVKLAEFSKGSGLEGSWNLTVTARNCQTGDAIRSFPAMHTYMFGGTMQDFGTGGAPLPRSSGQGVWSYASNRQYAAAFQFFRFNADGSYAGKQINRLQIELSPAGDDYTSSSMAQTFDVAGNLVATNCFTAAGTRFE